MIWMFKKNPADAMLMDFDANESRDNKNALDWVLSTAGANLKAQKKFFARVGLAAAAISAVAFMVAALLNQSASNRLQWATEIQMQSQRAAILSSQATRGEAMAVVDLKNVRKHLTRNIDLLKNGRALTFGLGTSLKPLNDFFNTWRDLDGIIVKITQSEDALLGMSKHLPPLKKSIEKARINAERVKILSMQRSISRLDDINISAVGSAVSNIEQMLGSIKESSLIPTNLRNDMMRDALIVRDGLDGMLTGAGGQQQIRDPVLVLHLERMRADYKPLVQSAVKSQGLSESGSAIERLAVSLNDISMAKKSAIEISNLSERALRDMQVVMQVIAEDQKVFTALIVAFLAMAMATIAGGVFSKLSMTESKAETTAIENSISMLMEDLSNIADGDLTVSARVTEDVTGTIADSVNFTVSNLHKTISGVSDMSTKVSEAAAGAMASTEITKNAVNRQTEQIENAAAAVLSMTESIKSVARSAEESASVAGDALAASTDGTQAVREVMEGMEQIRAEIQETSKRIKHLGESSQEIGEIITTIRDMADQSSVLALNASIQADAAGEHGRGFRTVASEVRRLADHSEVALKEVSKKVGAIQIDTKNAMEAMEKSTGKVVSGSALTARAGDALDKIENISNRMSLLSIDISRATATQDVDASNIRERISEVRDIAHHTSAEMNETADKINAIATLSTDLKAGVSGFKL